jgi:hypothetical protein
MKHVSLGSIEKAIQKVDNLNEEALEKLAETFALAQPTPSIKTISSRGC